MKTKSLFVLFGSKTVGQLFKLDDGRFEFEYEKSWLQEKNNFPLSLSMPVKEGRFNSRLTRSYFENLDDDHVKQFHMAGHSLHNDVRIDTHDHAPCWEVLELFTQATKKWPNVPTLLEWDDKIPEWQELMNELDRVKSCHAGAL